MTTCLGRALFQTADSLGVSLSGYVRDLPGFKQVFQHDQILLVELARNGSILWLTNRENTSALRRIAVIGNGGGGKSTLCRALGERLGLPVYEVDAVQWLPGWQRAALAETSRILDGWAAQETWIIDGFGPVPVIERRLARADTIVFIDFPFARHLWWSAKRQLAARVRGQAWAGQRRPPPNLVLFRTLRMVNAWRPLLLKMVSRSDRAARLVQLRSPSEVRRWLGSVERTTARSS